MPNPDHLEIRVGGYYVCAKGGSLIRHIYDVTQVDGHELLCWESNLLINGARDRMICSARHLQRWSSREATAEEVERFWSAPKGE